MAKKGQEQTKNKEVSPLLPPEVSPTIPQEITTSIESMKKTHQDEEIITKQQWEEKKHLIEKKEKSMYKDFYKKIAKGEGQNPILKKNKNIGGVRGKFHPSKKGKTS